MYTTSYASIAMKLLAFTLASLCLMPLAYGDGLPLKNGRYPGPVVVFELTSDQKEIIDHYRICQLERSRAMNIYTPYIFKLTGAQAEVLKRKVGFVPARFNVYETVRGFNDAGPHWNLVLRYSNDNIEIPLNLLLNEKAASAAHMEQGWKKENPCFPSLSK